MAAKEGVSPQELCDKCASLLLLLLARALLELTRSADADHKIHADSYEWFEIGFDHFGRTSTPKQTECVPPFALPPLSLEPAQLTQTCLVDRICQDIFLKLYNNGWLEEHENQQLYCEKDKRFLADRYVEGTCPKCHYDVRPSPPLCLHRA